MVQKPKLLHPAFGVDFEWYRGNRCVEVLVRQVFNWRTMYLGHLWQESPTPRLQTD